MARDFHPSGFMIIVAVSRLGPDHQSIVSLSRKSRDSMVLFFVQLGFNFDCCLSRMTSVACLRFRAALIMLLASAARPAAWISEGFGIM